MALQVTNLTSREGNSLSAFDRSFISFSFGGKDIEDFDLIVSFANDFLEKSLYPNFNAYTSSSNELDGQLYWGSVYSAAEYQFTLATDGITAAKLEKFKNWFNYNTIRTFTLTENPNRYTYARVSSAPQIALIPFEETVSVKVGSTSYDTPVVLYKGTIQLELVCDEPFWYSSSNSLTGTLTEANLRMIYDDGIPHTAMFNDENVYFLSGNEMYYEDAIHNNNGYSVTANTSYYVYNCGSKDAKPTISFTLTPLKSGDYIYFPRNAYGGATAYSYLTIGTKQFKYTTPAAIACINSAISIVKSYSVGSSIVEIIAELRTKLSHNLGRAWAVGVANNLKSSTTYVTTTGAITSSFSNQFQDLMYVFISSAANTYYSESYTFNCKEGTASYTTTVRVITGSFTTVSEALTNSSAQTLTENCGEAMKSAYIGMAGGCRPSNGFITSSEALLLQSSDAITSFKLDYKYTYD